MLKKLGALISWEARLRDYRVLLSLSLPLVVNSFSNIATGIVDTALVGRYSVEALAAVGVATSVYFAFVVVILSSAIGHSVMAAQGFGARRYQRVGALLQNSFALYGALAVVGMVLCVAGANFIAGFFSDNSEIQTGIADYLRIRGAGIGLITVGILMISVFSANRETKWALYIGVTLSVVNILVSWVLIFGVGIFPELGVSGSALGSLAADGVAVVFALAIFFFKGYHKLIWPGRFGLSRYVLRQLFKLGWPSLISVTTLHVSFLLALWLMGRLGVDELAAGRIVLQYVLLAFTLIYSFHAAGQIMAGRLIGERKWAAISALHRRNAELAIAAYLTPMIVFLIFPQWVIGVFTEFAAVSELALAPLRVAVVSAVLIAWSVNNVAFSRGLGKTTWDMVAMSVAVWVFAVPLMFVFADALEWGLTGIFAAQLFLWGTRGAILQALLWRLFRNQSGLQPIDKHV